MPDSTNSTPNHDGNHDRKKVQARWGTTDFTNKLEQSFWINHPLVEAYLNRLATGDPACDWLTWFTHACLPTDHQQRVLVLGCGDGWLERSIANLDWVEHIDACDVAEGAVDRARQQAREENLHNIDYAVLDLNQDTLAKNTYDVVIAHSVLHHIENLEHAFAQINGCLKPSAWLAINEFVGRPHLQYSEDAIQRMNAVMQCLDERLRISVANGELIPRKDRPGLAYMLDLDPSEGVRANQLDRFVRHTFKVTYEAPMGGTLLQLLLWDMARNFKSGDPIDDCLLSLICLLEDSLIQAGSLPSDYHFYVCRPANLTGHDTPVRLEPPSPGLVRQPPAVTSTSEPAHHQAHPLEPARDWLHTTLAELKTVGIGPSASVLWLGGDRWLLEQLEQHFKSVTRHQPKLHLNPLRRFDAAFTSHSHLLQAPNRHTLARMTLLLRRTGAFVAIEPALIAPQNQVLVDRFAQALAKNLAQPHLPAYPSEAIEGGNSTAWHRDGLDLDLFQIEKVTPLGHVLLEPLMAIYGPSLKALPAGTSVIQLLTEIETQLLEAGVLQPSLLGVLFCGPRRRAVLSAVASRRKHRSLS